METESSRDRAIKRLKTIRAELVREQGNRPGEEHLTLATNARMFNEALDLLEGELGAAFVDRYCYGDDRIIPKSKKKGGNPPVDAVGRDLLIREINAVLKQLGDPDHTAGGTFR